MRPETLDKKEFSVYQRGLATVEFALVATLLFVLLFAGLDFGRLMQQNNVLKQAVDVGTRYWSSHFFDEGGVPNPASETEARSRLTNFIGQSGAGMTSGKLGAITATRGVVDGSGHFTPDANGNYVRMEASYSFTWITPIPDFLAWNSTTKTLNASATYVITNYAN